MSGKNILLAVVGMSPEVITETLYALHKQERRVDAIHCITTTEGRDNLLKSIFASSDKHNQVKLFCAEHGLEPNSISVDSNENLHVLTDQDGDELNDILTAEHNEILLGKCLSLAWQFTTKDPEKSVFFLVAGGRKTMTSCLTLAAQFYGRPQDRLYHVLADPKWVEDCDFWFPKKNLEERIKDRSGRSPGIHKEVKINLIDIPFPSIRKYLPEDVLQRPTMPGDLMSGLIRDVKPNLVVNLKDRTITLGNIQLDLESSELMIYAFFAIRKQNCDKEFCNDCDNCFFEMSQIETTFENEILTLQNLIRDLSKITDTRQDTLKDKDVAGDRIRSIISKLNKKINLKYGLLNHDLTINPIGKRGNYRYGINFDRSRITITPERKVTKFMASIK